MTTILIVEDDQTLRETLAYNVQSEGYAALTADDGEQALAAMRAEKPDLVVLDVMLPKLDGLAVCRLARRDPDIAHIPIIMLTARAMQSDKMVGLDSGADDYITKPFDLDEFLARVRAVLRRAGGRSPAPPNADALSAGDLRVDLAAHKASKGDTELRLSGKEFSLLVELMRNQSVVLSRDLILARVWGQDTLVDDRTIDVHIRWLREKIEADPANPQRIVTVRGIGYRFEP